MPFLEDEKKLNLRAGVPAVPAESPKTAFSSEALSFLRGGQEEVAPSRPLEPVSSVEQPRAETSPSAFSPEAQSFLQTSIPREAVPAKDMGGPERLGRHFIGGALGTAEGMGGALQWLTDGALGKDFSDYMGGLRKEITPEGEASFMEQLASGAGSMATFFIPGFGAARGAMFAAKIAPRAAQWIGAGTMAVTEAATEAGQVYRDELGKGKGDDRANGAASWTFWLNLPVLTLTDKLAFFGNEGKVLSRALRGMVTEGSQESLQEVISTWSKEEQQSLKNILTSGAIGAILGGGVGAIAKPLPEAEKTPPATTPPATTGEAELQASQEGAARGEVYAGMQGPREVAPPTDFGPESPPEAATPQLAPVGVERGAPSPEIEAAFGTLPLSREDAIRELVPKTGSQEQADRFFDLYQQGDIATAQREFSRLRIDAPDQQRVEYPSFLTGRPREPRPTTPAPMGVTGMEVATRATSANVTSAETSDSANVTSAAKPFDRTGSDNPPPAPMGVTGGMAQTLATRRGEETGAALAEEVLAPIRDQAALRVAPSESLEVENWREAAPSLPNEPDEEVIAPPEALDASTEVVQGGGSAPVVGAPGELELGSILTDGEDGSKWEYLGPTDKTWGPARVYKIRNIDTGQENEVHWKSIVESTSEVAPPRTTAPLPSALTSKKVGPVVGAKPVSPRGAGLHPGITGKPAKSTPAPTITPAPNVAPAASGEVAPESQAGLGPPPFTHYNLKMRASNSANLVPGVGKKFTNEEIQQIKDWLPAGVEVTGSPTSIRVIWPHNTQLDIPDGFDLARREKQAAADVTRKAEKAAKDAAFQKEYDDSPSSPWIEKTFGPDFAFGNIFNKVKLARVLDGGDKTYQGLMDRSWIEPLRKLGIEPAGKNSDIIAGILAAYQKSKPLPTAITGKAGPVAQAKPVAKHPGLPKGITVKPKSVNIERAFVAKDVDAVSSVLIPEGLLKGQFVGGRFQTPPLDKAHLDTIRRKVQAANDALPADKELEVRGKIEYPNGKVGLTFELTDWGERFEAVTSELSRRVKNYERTITPDQGEELLIAEIAKKAGLTRKEFLSRMDKFTPSGNYSENAEKVSVALVKAADKTWPDEKPKVPAAPTFKAGDRVSWTERGKTLTGTLKGAPDRFGNVDINVDQVVKAGGVPVGRVFMDVKVESLTKLETESTAPEAKPEAAPVKYQIGDMVMPKSGIMDHIKEPQRVQLVYENADGTQRLKLVGSGNLTFNASNFDLVETKPQAAEKAAHVKLAKKIKDWLDSAPSAKMDSMTLFTMANKAYGGTMAQGAYTPKDAYDAMELGVNLHIQSKPEIYNPHSADPAAVVKHLEALINVLPTQTRRTGEMDEFQQFSTPPHLAYMVSWVANIGQNDVAMEPSAGIGGIAVFAHNAEAKEVIVNELSPRRAELLREMGFDQVFTENAEQLNNILPKTVKPTVVVMNPPFSATAGRMMGKRISETGAQHIDQALKRLEPGGRLVAIVGRGMAFGKPTFATWWTNIKKEYNVLANVGISGKNYTKYGTSFDNQILVIDKTGPTTQQPVAGAVERIEELIPLLEGVKDARQHVTDQSSSQTGATPTETQAGPKGTVSRPTPGVVEKKGGTPEVGVTDSGDVGNVGPADGSVAPGNNAGVRGKSGGQGGAVGLDGTVQSGKTDVSPESGAGGVGATGKLDVGKQSVRGQSDAGASGAVNVEATEGEESKSKLTDSIYEAYTPQRLKVPGAKPHPAKLVESAAMSSVKPPVPTYKPQIPQKVISEGNLSDSQMEAVVYAGQAHNQMLESGERRGFAIGDGTGVGKGREISGIFLDNWEQGRKKGVWISQNGSLLGSAQRDVQGIGWDPRIIKPLPSNYNPLTGNEGILFLGYDTLKARQSTKGDKEAVPKTRMDQIVEWLGEDFDGVIAFDEAHNMNNSKQPQNAGLRTQKASQKALAGVELQKRLPNARVVYVSATMGEEVEHFAFADRLGLWGPGTEFTDKNDFLSKVASGGVASMEVVARDMKALGAYLARSLSFDGVKYERLTHDLSSDQTATYDALAKVWQVVFANVEKALEDTGAGQDTASKRAALGQFWGYNQRFFNQVTTALAMPSVLKTLEEDLAKGHSPVLQLVNTYGDAQDKAIKNRGEDVELDELDMTPRQMLAQYLERSFPTVQYETYIDDNGDEQVRVVLDSDGNPVHNQEAIAARDKMLTELGMTKFPDNPIDQIINKFGPDMVAEITGRKQRLIKVKGETRLEKRGDAAVRNDIKAYNDGTKRILIFSQKGDTGASYHADLSIKNQALRRHYLLQAGWQAKRALQGFGRTHRTNQAQTPEYILVETNIKGHKRFISSIARRLDQLGALTKGQRQTGSSGLLKASDNLETVHAEIALERLVDDLIAGQIEDMTADEFMEQTGWKLTYTSGGSVTINYLTVKQFMNRMLAMQVNYQNIIYEAFDQRHQDVITRAADAGTLDLGMETIFPDQGGRIEKVSEELVYTEPNSGAETRVVAFDITNPTKPTIFEQAEGTGIYFYQNKTSGQVWAIEDRPRNETQDDGTIKTFYVARGQRQGARQWIQDRVLNDKDKWVGLKKAAAKPLWDAAVAKLPKESTDRLNMITGTLLPIWKRLSGDTRVKRLQTQDGKKYLGRVIPNSDLNETLTKLGATSQVQKLEVKNSGDILEKVLDNNWVVTLANGWKFRRALVSGEQRIELIGARPEDLPELTRAGLIVEKISYQTRAFVPTRFGTAIQSLEAINAIIKRRPVVEAAPRFTSDAARYSLAARGGLGRSAPGEGPTITLQAVQERFGGVKVHELEGGKGFHLTLPNGKLLMILTGQDLTARRDEVLATYGREMKAGEWVAGEWRQMSVGGVVALAKGAGIRTLDHETFHAACDLVLSQKELNSILKKYGDWEAAARAYESWKPATAHPFFQKILNFFRRLAGLLGPTADGTFAKIKSGEVWTRPAAGPGTGATGMFRKANVTPEGIYDLQRKLGKFNTAKNKQPGDMNFFPVQYPIPMGKVGDYLNNAQAKETLSPEALKTPIYVVKHIESNITGTTYLMIYDPSKKQIQINGAIDFHLNPGALAHSLAHEAIHAQRTVLGRESKAENYADRTLPWEVSADKGATYISGLTAKQAFIGLSEVVPKDVMMGMRRYSLRGGDPEAVLTQYHQDLMAQDPASKSLWRRFWDKDPALKASWTEMSQKAYDQVVDRFAPGERAQNKLAKAGITMPAGEQFTSTIGFWRGQEGWNHEAVLGSGIYTDQMETLGSGESFFTGATPTRVGDSLFKRVDPIRALAKARSMENKEVFRDLRLLMVAQRDLELAGETGTRAPGTIKGVRPDESRAALQALETKYGQDFSQLQDAAGAIREWADQAILQRLVQAGVISQDLYDKIKSQNQAYIPFMRLMDELDQYIKSTGGGKVIKEIKGSERAIVDPFQMLIELSAKANYAYAKNRMIRSLYQMGQASPEMGIKELKPKIIPSGMVHKDKWDPLGKSGWAMERELPLLKKGYAFSQLPPEPGAIPFYKDGKRTWLKLPPDLHGMMQNLLPEDLGLLMRILKIPADILRTGAVTTPEFGLIKNPLRDLVQAWLFNRAGFSPAKWFRDLYLTLSKNPNALKMRAEMAAGGGFMATLAQSTVDEHITAADIEGKKKNIAYAAHPVEALRTLSAYLENLTRFSLYKQARENGLSHAEAVHEARRTTLDFRRLGAHPVARYLNMIIPFWNANIQGTDKLITELRGPNKAAVLRRLGTLMAASVGLALLFHGDDRLKELEDWEKNYFWHIPLGKTGPIIRLPKPFEAGILFGSVPERLVEVAMGDNTTGLKAAVSAAYDALTPEIIPAALRPFVELKSNYNFFLGRPIEDASLQSLPVELRSKPWTTPLAKSISAHGGNLIGLSPVKVEHFVRSFSGGLGANYYFPGADLLLRKAGILEDLPNPQQDAIERAFGVRALFTKPPAGYRAKSVGDFFENVQNATRADQGWKTLWNTGSMDKLDAFLKDNPEAMFARVARQQMAELGKIKKERTAIHLSKALTSEQKRAKMDALDERIVTLARAGNALMDPAVAEAVKMPARKGMDFETYKKASVEFVGDAYDVIRKNLPKIVHMEEAQRQRYLIKIIRQAREDYKPLLKKPESAVPKSPSPFDKPTRAEKARWQSVMGFGRIPSGAASGYRMKEE